MPIPEYASNTPMDSRWRWVTPVPDSWLTIDPPAVASRVMAVLDAALIGWRGGRADVSFGTYAGKPAIYVNADDDPSDLFSRMAEPPEPVANRAIADATARLQAFKSGTYTGARDDLIDDLVTVVLTESRR